MTVVSGSFQRLQIEIPKGSSLRPNGENEIEEKEELQQAHRLGYGCVPDDVPSIDRHTVILMAGSD
jgi:hypothetical protein